MSIKVECLVYKNEGLVQRFESKSLLGNFARLLAGSFANANIDGMRDITGTAYTARTAADVNASVPTLVIGTGTAPPTPDDYMLASQTELPTTTLEVEFPTYAQLYIFGARSAAATETWSEMGFIQPLFDSGGTARKTLLARDVLPSPVTLNPGDVAVFVYVITVAV